MELLIKARTEEEILKAVSDDTTAEEIVEAMAVTGEGCVDSRCGCSSCK